MLMYTVYDKMVLSIHTESKVAITDKDFVTNAIAVEEINSYDY